MKDPFVSMTQFSADPEEPALWFIFQGNQLLVQRTTAEQADLPRYHAAQPADLNLLRHHYLGYLPGSAPLHCFTGEVSTAFIPPAGMEFSGLRQLFGRLSERDLWLAGRAIQIIDWDRNHQFCSRCGDKNAIQPHERAKRCPSCALVTYPRLSPAIIVRVDRQDGPLRQMLLARAHRFPAGFYSVLAGFVEPGESLEDCVRREVHEEVGIDLQNIHYFGSQSWPFPNSLMVAFTAEYAGGKITLEEEEIADAGWYTTDNLPKIPPPMSIARQMIDDFVQRYGAIG